jgi:hypothetical protein
MEQAPSGMIEKGETMSGVEPQRRQRVVFAAVQQF